MTKKLAPFRSVGRTSSEAKVSGLLENAVIRRVSPPVDETALREIIGGETHASKKRRSEPGERVTVILPPDLLKRLRIQAIDEGCSVSHAITEAVRAWLE